MNENVKNIEDFSWVRVRDKDIFSRRVIGRPSDEGARSVRSKNGKDCLYLARVDFEEFYIFKLGAVTVISDYILYLKTRECKQGRRNVTKNEGASEK